MKCIFFHPLNHGMSNLRVMILLCTVSVGAILASQVQATTQAQTGRQILEKMEANQRALTDSVYVKSRLSSCRYGVDKRKIKCAEKPRVKLLESVGINDGAEEKDTKSVTLVLSPAAEKGVGLLHYAYEKPDRDNETWIYLSALGKVKRIASGNSEDESEPASIFGSEFTTEDTDTGKLDDYDIRIVGEAVESGRPVWKIETRPRQERARKTRYARTLLYVDKERFVALRIEMYDRHDTEIKRLLASHVEQIDGIWLARSRTMMNLVTNRLSNMARLGVTRGMDIARGFITQRTLTDVAFREAELLRLRAQIQ